MHKRFLPAVVMSALTFMTCQASSSKMVVRSIGGADRSIELSQISEVVFDNEMVCVKMTSGTDFTMADSKFVSLRFDNNGVGLPDQSSINEITLNDDDTESVYDLNGRFIGTSTENLDSGIYLIVKPGSIKKIVK